jgi:hypothetical protein
MCKMALDGLRTETGSRPDLAALEVNAPIGYIGGRILPPVRISGKAGTVYDMQLVADAAATTSRSAGAAPQAVSLTENSSAISCAELIKRYKVPWEGIPLMGGLAATDALGAKAAKRSVMNALETAQLAVLVDGAGTSITSAIVDGIIDACDQVHRYNGKTAFVCDVGIYRWLIQQTEIKNLMVRTFGGMGAMESLSLVPNVFKSMLQALFGIDEVLIADDKFYPYSYRTTAAVVKLPTPDETSFVTDPELGRTFIYWPTDGNMFEINSYPDDDIRSNVYDATVWYDAEQFNSAAKVLLTLSTSGSTTA